jgi:hypothetical protein
VKKKDRDMRYILFALALSFAQPVILSPAFAQDSPEAAIQSTIQNQITAFQADDFARAFTYASPTIKGMFGTAENFGMMVQRGYPMVHRPESLRMLELREVEGQLWQRVMVTDAKGTTHMLDYQMIQTAQGWQINAVQLLPQSGVGA